MSNKITNSINHWRMIIMAVHTSKNKTTAKQSAKRWRKKGLNATVSKTKKGWKVYTDQKGKR